MNENKKDWKVPYKILAVTALLAGLVFSVLLRINYRHETETDLLLNHWVAWAFVVGLFLVGAIAARQES